MSLHSEAETKTPQSDGESQLQADLDGAHKGACSCGCKTCRKPRYWLWILGFFVVYVVSAVPLGLFVYTLKKDFGWNVFNKGGIHSYFYCVRHSFKADDLNR